VLAIPTYCRKLYLQRCLESIVRMKRPDSVAIHLLLLDNNPGGEARKIFDEFSSRFEFPASYVHVKERGIAFVRNRTIEEALALDADFIAFLDDDEEASAEWMVEAFRALDSYRGDVVSGPTVRILPEGVPQWMRQSRGLGIVKRAEREGPGRGPVSTNNVIFKTFLAKDWGLRFRTDFNLTGGSDTVFFEEAIRRGAAIVWSRKAKVYEWIPPSRAKLSWMLRRNFRVGINKLRRVRLFDGERAAWRIALAGLWDVLAVRPLRLLARELRRSPRRAFRGRFVDRGVNYLAHAAHSLGMAAALFGYRYHEYQKPIHGE